MFEEFEEDVDGLLYLDETLPPEPENTEAEESDESEWGDDLAHRTDRGAGNVLYRRVLAKWKDPTTPPHVRKKCVKRFKYPGGWTCTGWKIQYRWLYRTATLEVATKSGVDVKNALEDCLKEAAIVALVSALVSGGSAAGPAAAAAIKECLARKLASSVIDVQIVLKSKRGDWK